MTARGAWGSSGPAEATATTTKDRTSEHVFERFEALASRWDLDRLHLDLTDVLDSVDENSRPFDPTRLQEALRMYLDSYGPHRTANR